jgi:hypothetical protein
VTETFRLGSYTSRSEYDLTLDCRRGLGSRRPDEMKLTDWLAVASTVQNGWTLTALIAILLYLYFSRRGAG